MAISCHRVLALAEVVVADPALRIGEVDRRPVVVVEGVPDAVVAVDGDRVRHPQRAGLGDDVVDVVLEVELRRMDADRGQPLSRVLRIPGADVGQRAQPVDAGVGPEVDEDDPTPQPLGRQRVRVQPAGRPRERGQVAFHRQLAAVTGQMVHDRAEETGEAGWCSFEQRGLTWDFS